LDVKTAMKASGSPSERSEEFARQRMHDASVVPTTTNALRAEIAKDRSMPNGRQRISWLFRTSCLPWVEGVV
jgi:hypothetical protein